MMNVSASLGIIRWLAVILLCTPGYANSPQGLTTPFVDVVVLDVPLGESRSVEDSEGRGLVLTNRSDQPLAIAVSVLLPSPEQLRGNARSLPDPSWISIKPSEIFLPPQESVTCELRVFIPKEKQYAKQFYQAMISSRARPVNRRGVTLSVELLSRLRIHTNPYKR